MLAAAVGLLRARRKALAALGVFAAAVVAGTATTVGFGLATGFDRAARQADLPDVIARFDREEVASVDRRVRALPNLAARSYRRELTRQRLRAGAQSTPEGVIHIVLGGRRGYAVVSGRDLSARPGEVLIEQGLARAWGLRPGDVVVVGVLGSLRVAGVVLSPDNVAFPLSKTARVYVGEQETLAAFPGASEVRADLALLWLADPRRADITLAQARATSFGIGNLAFVTRAGVEVLVGQAAGVVIALLAAFSLVALVAAGTMLAAGAHADVQRRLPGIGVLRAVGWTPGRVAGVHALEALLVALPAGALGVAVGALAVAGPAGDLLAALNQAPAGAALLGPLAAAVAGVVAVVCAAAAWPAWRAARRPPAQILRELPAGARARRLTGAPARAASSSDGGLVLLGARFATAARARWVAAVATVGVCAAVVALMLALATLLERLREDPGTVGKRYQLTAQLNPLELPRVRALPGVEAASERYVVAAADSFRLGEPLRLIAYPGDHTRFEAPPLAAGRRLRAADEVEVGAGLADALGLRPGSPLAVQTPGGAEARFRVSGVVRALENDGRIAWARPNRLLEADPGLAPSSLAIRLEPGADRARVEAGLRALGARPQRATAAATRDGRFLGILAAVLRGIGLAVGLVCLYALVQALAMTARERRRAVAMLRASGGDAATVGRVLAGASLAVAVPAAVLGLVLEHVVLAPLVARLAAGFAELPLGLSLGQAALVAGGLAVLAAGATWLVAARVMREPVIAGLREE